MKNRTLEQKRAFTGFTFIIPFIIGLLMFFVFPIVQSIIYSFSHVSIIQGGVQKEFAGLEYYQNALFKDVNFTRFLVSSLKELCSNVPIIIIFSLFIAVMLNEKFVGRGLMRSIFFLPLMLSSSVLLSIMSGNTFTGQEDSASVFMVSSFSISDILIQTGLPLKFVGYLTALIDQIFNITWLSGVQIILFLAALQSIPESLKEAANVEGATAWEYFWKITIPMISPMILVNIVFTAIDSFTSYSNVLISYITSEASNLRYSFSSAMTWIYFLVISLVLTIVVGLFSKKVFYLND